MNAMQLPKFQRRNKNMTDKNLRMQICRLLIKYDLYLLINEDAKKVRFVTKNTRDETLSSLILKGYLLKAGIIKPEDDELDYAIMYIYDNILLKSNTFIEISMNEDDIPFYNSLYVIMRCRGCMSDNQISEAINNISI